MEIKFIDVLITVLSLVLLMVPGFIMAKAKMLPENATETLSTIVLYLCQTMLVFACFQNYEYDAQIALNMLYVAGLAFAVHFIMIGLLYLVVRGDDAKKRCLRYGSVFSNCGYMGIPLLKMLFEGTGSQGEILIYTAVVLSVWNIVNWTFGVYMMTKDKKEVSVKKIVLNPVIIAVVLGFLSFIILKKPIKNFGEPGSPLNSILTKIMGCVNFFGEAVTPLSMTVIGIKLANVNLKQLFLDKQAYLCSLFKLIIMSVITMLVVSFLPIDVTVKYALFFCLSMPAASSTTLFAVKFKGDGDFASVCVLLSTILSIITIPLMFLVLGGVFGVTV